MATRSLGRVLSIVGLLLASVAGGWIAPALGQNTLRDRLRDFRVGDFWIYDDWPAAVALAKETGAPIFAVFRCVP